MATGALSAFGTLLRIGDGVTPIENFTTVTEVVEISGPNLSLNTADATSHDSPGGWRERIATILDNEEITFSINYIPTDATHDAGTGLIADMVARTLRNFEVIFPDVGTTTWAFSAFITSFQPTEPHDNKLSADVTLTPSGQPTLA